MLTAVARNTHRLPLRRCPCGLCLGFLIITFPSGRAAKCVARFGEIESWVMIDTLDDRFKSGAYNWKSPDTVQ